MRQAAMNDIELGGENFAGDAAGALYWPAQRVLVVSDMHLEKGSSYARFGSLLPPYDSAATLARLCDAVTRCDPRIVIALGDSFHDGDGPQRLGDAERAGLCSLQRGRDWIWISGNHDPDPASGIGGVFREIVNIGKFVFRHEPGGNADENEIAGHLHPIARVSARGRAVSRKCYASDGRRMVMPAFGAFTGGLNVRNRAFAAIFETLDFTAHMLGQTRLYAVAAAHCLPD